MFEHVVSSSMTSHGSTMTSLTDHSVESILRQDNSKTTNSATSHVTSAISGHVNNTTGNVPPSLTQHGDRHVTTGHVMNKSLAAGTKPRLELECPELWHTFYSLCTEMVITKTGRLLIKQFFHLL